MSNEKGIKINFHRLLSLTGLLSLTITYTTSSTKDSDLFLFENNPATSLFINLTITTRTDFIFLLIEENFPEHQSLKTFEREKHLNVKNIRLQLSRVFSQYRNKQIFLS